MTTRVHTGQLFATFSDPATFVNRLTGPQRDPRTHTPQYKVTAVRLEPISPPELGSPLLAARSQPGHRLRPTYDARSTFGSLPFLCQFRATSRRRAWNPGTRRHLTQKEARWVRPEPRTGMPVCDASQERLAGWQGARSRSWARSRRLLRTRRRGSQSLRARFLRPAPRLRHRSRTLPPLLSPALVRRMGAFSRRHNHRSERTVSRQLRREVRDQRDRRAGFSRVSRPGDDREPVGDAQTSTRLGMQGARVRARRDRSRV